MKKNRLLEQPPTVGVGVAGVVSGLLLRMGEPSLRHPEALPEPHFRLCMTDEISQALCVHFSGIRPGLACEVKLLSTITLKLKRTRFTLKSSDAQEVVFLFEYLLSYENRWESEIWQTDGEYLVLESCREGTCTARFHQQWLLDEGMIEGLECLWGLMKNHGCDVGGLQGRWLKVDSARR